MLAPNLDFLWVIVAVVYGVPILFGSTIIIWASSVGAQSVARLALDRRLLAMSVGVLTGLLVFAGVFVAVFSSMHGTLLSLLPPTLLATMFGALTAFKASAKLNANLNHYKCKNCGARFRRQFVSDRCDRCAESADRSAPRRDRIATQQAIRHFAERYRELQNGDDSTT